MILADGGIVLVAAQTSTVSIHWSAIWGSVAGVLAVFGALRQYVVKPVQTALAEIRSATIQVADTRTLLADHLHWHNVQGDKALDEGHGWGVPWDGTDRRAPGPPSPAHRRIK